MTTEPTGPWRAYVQHDWATDNKRVYLYRGAASGRFPTERWFATGFTWEQIPEGTYGEQIKPLTEITRAEIADNVGSFLQAVFDAAWESGMRPSGFKDFANELSAVKYHLEDMRTLVLNPRRA